MPRIAWDAPGTHLYFAGIDRGMLYIDDNVAVPWLGLSSFTEAIVGGDAQPYYLDGQKILNAAIGEDFGGTIEAFGAPAEFAPCAGRAHLSTGLYVSDQPKKIFNFSYRTLIGNDSEGTDFGYKLHVVYNATAKISDYTHSTDSNSPSVAAHSWDITTFPANAARYKPTAHFIFDTRYVQAYVIGRLEAILYGDINNDPRMPTADELITFLTSPPGVSWWDVTGLTDFPVDALIGDMGLDFGDGDVYADDAVDNNAYMWDLTGGADFPPEAIIGDWGVDDLSGEVWQYTE